MIESVPINGRNVLTLRTEAGRTERQWKSVLSWMLGIAGTRHVLALETYRWIAPLSAFYPDAVQVVDLSAWHVSFPRSSVVIDRDPESRSRLRPDYVALGSPGGRLYEWAVVEAKGTQASLASIANCPTAWANQVRNVVITVDGSNITIPRHLVVATRVNPNATRRSTRRIQVRAWNRREDAGLVRPNLPQGFAADIAAAHLFGLFRGLQLRENALALALSVQARAEAHPGRVRDATRRESDNIAQRCDVELRERTRRPQRADGSTSTVMQVATDRGTIDVEIIEPVVTLARKLQRAENEDTAAAALQEADAQIDDWERPRRAGQHEHADLWLPFGVELRLPDAFKSR